MFTEQDHAKAVELHKTYKDAEWWPDIIFHPDGGWCMHHVEFGWIGMGRNHALSAIAWAMVERLGDIDLHCYDGWWSDDNRNNVGGPTRFLALAAAIENTHKEA
jgi:hypothetical protein